MRKAESINFKDIKVGLTKEFTVKITEEMLVDFARISGDYNPLHMDDVYAKSTKFKKRVVHGMLLSTFLSRMVGMHLPGQKALYLSQDLKFKNPGFIGDTIKVIGKVMAISEGLKLITLETVIQNQDDQVLVKGEAQVSYLEG